MAFKLLPVAEDEKEILRNLLEKYLHEFSQYDGQKVNRLGLFGYPWLDHYWNEDNRWAYFFMCDDKLAGFALINDFPEVEDRDTDFQMAEFFVLHPYRRSGLGRKAFFEILRRHQGRWQLKMHPKNMTSVHFWRRVIQEHTRGKFDCVEAYPKTEYADGTLGSVFFFNS